MKRLSIKAVTPVEQSLYTLVNKFGPARGPRIPQLTEKGTELAFTVANGVKLSASSIEILIKIRAMGPKGVEYSEIVDALSPHRNRPAKTYVDFYKDPTSRRVWLKPEGTQAIEKFHREREKLLARILLWERNQ